jgi:hypothetical protein
VGDKHSPGVAERRSGSKWSLWSEDSLLSIGSHGSVLSIGSVGSALSIGSIGSVASAFSIGSAVSLGSIMSFRARRGVMKGARSELGRCDVRRR